MKSIYSKLITAAVIIAIGAYVFSVTVSPRRSRAKREQARMEERLRVKQAVTDMITKFDAVEEWEASLDKTKTHRSIYTIDIRQALLQTGGRPILVYGSLDDVLDGQEQDILRFTDFLIGLETTIFFELQCDKEKTKALLEAPTSFIFDDFAVVAEIQEVSKPRFVVKAYPSEAYEYEEEIEIESSDALIATGRCLDFVFVRSWYGDW